MFHANRPATEKFRGPKPALRRSQLFLSMALPGHPAPAYLTDELCQVADVEARRRLRSSSSSSLIVSSTRLSTIGDRAFPVAAARVWNSLPDHVTSAPSVAVFRSRLKTHLFNISYPSTLWLYSACAVTLSYFGHFNRSCLLTYLLTLTCRAQVVQQASRAIQWQHHNWKRREMNLHLGIIPHQICLNLGAPVNFV